MQRVIPLIKALFGWHIAHPQQGRTIPRLGPRLHPDDLRHPGQLLGALRLISRTGLHYPQSFPTALRAIRDQGMTIGVVEQNVYAALSIADTAYVMEDGHVVDTFPNSALESKSDELHKFLGV